MACALLSLLWLAAATPATADEETGGWLISVAADHALRSEYEEANAIWRELAVDGDMEAMCQLGLSNLLGEGIEKDALAGVAMMKDAARQGHVYCQSMLTLVLANGVGFSARNFANGVCWGLPSAVYGDPLSQYYIYSVSGDEAWLYKSARQGFFPAMEELVRKAPIDGTTDESSVYLIEMAFAGHGDAMARLDKIDTGAPGAMADLIARKVEDPNGFWSANPVARFGLPPQGDAFSECE